MTETEWGPGAPGYREERDHPEVWFSPSEGYIVRALRRVPDRQGPLVRVTDRGVVHKLPADVELICLPHEFHGAAREAGR